MKKLIILSLFALILSPFNPILHVADAASILDAINPNDVGETIQNPFPEEIVETPTPPPCTNPSNNSVSNGVPCPIIAGPDTPGSDTEVVVNPTPNPCVNQPNNSVLNTAPCPLSPLIAGPDTAVSENEIASVIPPVGPCVNQAINSVSSVAPCPLIGGPDRPGRDIEIISVNPPVTPCVNPAIDSVSTVTPCPAAPRPDRPVNDTETEGIQVIEVNNPTPPTGGGGGGGGFIFPPTTTPTTTPTTPTNPDQQVLGEQIFADNTPVQQVLGDRVETSVLGEQVTSPTFPKTGAAPMTSNSIIWQLALTFVLSSVLIISLNQKKTIVASK